MTYSTWFTKNKQIKTSNFFDGENIFDKLYNSLYAQIVETCTKLFDKEYLKEYNLPKVVLVGNELIR